jgi:hypothetical protein
VQLKCQDPRFLVERSLEAMSPETGDLRRVTSLPRSLIPVPILMSIQHLTREISAIESKTETLAAQIQETYQDYLERLGITVQRQLVAAGYYLCTQLFPDVFLRLKYSDREKMQRSLQQIAEEAKQSLNLATLGNKILEESTPKDDFFLDDDEDEEDPEDSESGAESSSDENQREALTGEKDSDLDIGDTGDRNNDPSQPPSRTNPQVLADWYSEIEQAIGDVLRQVSQKATHILERSGVIHNQLPEPLLEVATQSEAAENVGSEHPNILNLVVEMGKMNEEGRKSSTQRIEIVAIYLRLSDLEFTDTYLVSHRNKLRSQLQQLKSLGKIYHKRNREYSIAQAESAWRSSWVEG